MTPKRILLGHGVHGMRVEFELTPGRQAPRLGEPEALVHCSGCVHYRSDPVGAGGIGSCAVQGQGTALRWPPLYPRARRRCSDREDDHGGVVNR